LKWNETIYIVTKRNCTFGNKGSLCKGDQEQCVEIISQDQSCCSVMSTKKVIYLFCFSFLFYERGCLSFCTKVSRFRGRDLCANIVEELLSNIGNLLFCNFIRSVNVYL
jgi:hypothetical protein